MNNKAASDWLAAVAVVILLILTAWGSALAMLAFSLLGLLVVFVFFRRRIGKSGVLVATLAFAVGVAIAVSMLLRLG